MKSYRIFPLAESGHVSGAAQVVEAEDDSHAMRTVCDRLDNDPLELWDGPRYIGTLTRNPMTAHADWIILVKS